MEVFDLVDNIVVCYQVIESKKLMQNLFKK